MSVIKYKPIKGETKYLPHPDKPRKRQSVSERVATKAKPKKRKSSGTRRVARKIFNKII